MYRPMLTACLLLTTLWGGATGYAEKEVVAREVFDQLVAARGQVGMPDPVLRFTTGKRSAARCEGNTIVLEEAAYDVCAALPAPRAALATILAHELAHYYERHEPNGGGTIGLIGGGGGDYAEREADYLGSFLANLAGYPTHEIMPQILDGIYAAYGLPDSLTGYPPLAERKQLAARSHDRMRRLRSVFEAANALVALERYAEAAGYYEYVLAHFPSREMYNNLGVIYARAALPYFAPTTLRFAYPLELDLRWRLEEQTRGITIDVETRQYYLQQARDHFDRARLLDADYAPALANLAAVHALLYASHLEGDPTETSCELAEDRYLEARLRAREAMRLGAQPAAADAAQVLGVLAAQRGDTTAALDYFALGQESPVAEVNAYRLRSDGLPPVADDRPGGFALRETIGDLAAVDGPSLEASPREVIPVATGMDRLVLSVYRSAGVAGGMLCHRAGEQNPRALWIVATPPDYGGATAMDVRVGGDMSDVTREYGLPGRRVPTVGGELLVYPGPDIVFELRSDRVRGWFLYAER